MTRTDHLETRVARLEELIDLLMGKPRGPISMTEARLARSRGEMAIVERFNMQENERILAEGGHGKTSQRLMVVTAETIGEN
jgi:hypothetical protein